MSDNVKKYGLWALKILAALAFLSAGYFKLTGAPMMVQTFDAIGVGQWFRIVTGAIEVAGAVLLFVPGIQAYGASLLAATMVGAVIAHVTILGAATMLPAVILLLITATIAWAHRAQLPIGQGAHA